MVNTILKEADLFCPNSVRINFTIYLIFNKGGKCNLKFWRSFSRLVTQSAARGGPKKRPIAEVRRTVF
ncbi:Aspartate aminotransferase [Levilactobacillus zymae]|uniref:Aspartate aminotransferase n=1 Tax=Levilactobacillus zymae TaxID=267363 RepID=A0A1Y6JWV9_9LACO|nr:Aspartate aminotransferase [Levilactobacillus zymae]